MTTPTITKKSVTFAPTPTIYSPYVDWDSEEDSVVSLGDVVSGGLRRVGEGWRGLARSASFVSSHLFSGSPPDEALTVSRYVAADSETGTNLGTLPKTTMTVPGQWSSEWQETEPTMQETAQPEPEPSLPGAWVYDEEDTHVSSEAATTITGGDTTTATTTPGGRSGRQGTSSKFHVWTDNTPTKLAASLSAEESRERLMDLLSDTPAPTIATQAPQGRQTPGGTETILDEHASYVTNAESLDGSSEEILVDDTWQTETARAPSMPGAFEVEDASTMSSTSSESTLVPRANPQDPSEYHAHPGDYLGDVEWGILSRLSQETVKLQLDTHFQQTTGPRYPATNFASDDFLPSNVPSSELATLFDPGDQPRSASEVVGDPIHVRPEAVGQRHSSTILSSNDISQNDISSQELAELISGQRGWFLDEENDGELTDDDHQDESRQLPHGMAERNPNESSPSINTGAGRFRSIVSTVLEMLGQKRGQQETTHDVESPAPFTSAWTRGNYLPDDISIGTVIAKIPELSRFDDPPPISRFTETAAHSRLGSMASRLGSRLPTALGSMATFV